MLRAGVPQTVALKNWSRDRRADAPELADRRKTGQSGARHRKCAQADTGYIARSRCRCGAGHMHECLGRQDVGTLPHQIGRQAHRRSIGNESPARSMSGRVALDGTTPSSVASKCSPGWHSVPGAPAKPGWRPEGCARSTRSNRELCRRELRFGKVKLLLLQFDQLFVARICAA